MKRSIYIAAMLTAVAGCEILGLGNDLTISALPQSPIPEGYVFRARVGGNNHSVPIGPGRKSKDVGERGSKAVTAAVLDPNGRVIGEVSFNQSFEPGSDNWISLEVGRKRPFGICIGSVHAAALTPPITEEVDSMFVMAGGIPKGAIC